MIKVVNDVLDSRKPTVLLSIDISAAFDMLDHDRLVNHVTELFGPSGQVIDRLESLLPVEPVMSLLVIAIHLLFTAKQEFYRVQSICSAQDCTYDIQSATSSAATVSLRIHQ